MVLFSQQSKNFYCHTFQTFIDSAQGGGDKILVKSVQSALNDLSSNILYPRAILDCRWRFSI